MISPIAFHGTYKVYNRQYEGIGDYFELMRRCEDSGIKTKMDFINYSKEGSIPVVDGQEVISTVTIVAPDAYDKHIEAFCKISGIKFKRLNQDELLDHKNIIERTIKEPKDNPTTKIVLVNAKKLEELNRKQTIGNYDQVRKDYKKYFKSETDFNLKSGDEIVAPTLFLNPNMAGGFKGAMEFIDRFGAENLNENSLFVDFVQMTDEPDHCMYFAMKDIGMKKIPVCVDKKTYELGSKIGLFE